METYGFTSISAIRAANKAAGFHFFDDDTMDFFDSKLDPIVIGGQYFISSEQSPVEGFPRRYTIRHILPDSSIETVGDFQQYTTNRSARAEANALVLKSWGPAVVGRA